MLSVSITARCFQDNWTGLSAGGAGHPGGERWPSQALIVRTELGQRQSD